MHFIRWRMDKFINIFVHVLHSYVLRFSVKTHRAISFIVDENLRKKKCFANNKPVNFMMMWVEV